MPLGGIASDGAIAPQSSVVRHLIDDALHDVGGEHGVRSAAPSRAPTPFVQRCSPSCRVTMLCRTRRSTVGLRFHQFTATSSPFAAMRITPTLAHNARTGRTASDGSAAQNDAGAISADLYRSPGVPCIGLFERGVCLRVARDRRSGAARRRARSSPGRLMPVPTSRFLWSHLHPSRRPLRRMPHIPPRLTGRDYEQVRGRC